MSFLRSSLNTMLFLKAMESFPVLSDKRSVKRWVAPTLRELKKRSKKLGDQEPQPRAGFIEWNHRSELFAFGKRLNEDFHLPILQTAFTCCSYAHNEQIRQRNLGIEDIEMTNNVELVELGKKVTETLVQAFLKETLPNIPEEGQRVLSDYLLSQSTLSHIAAHLGVKDLVLSAEYPPSEKTMATTFLAVVGALHSTASIERVKTFVRDFVCTQLNQRDLLELWKIESPEEMLKQICKERKLPEPESRLLGDCAKNTVLAAFQVGIYTNKQLLGRGFGEDISTAKQTASLNALQVIFGIQDNMKPLKF